MEQYLVRKDIKKCQSIYYHPDYHLFSGNGFRSCSKTGGPVRKYKEVKSPIHAIEILPDNKLLVLDGRAFLHILDLEKGIVLVSKKTSRELSGSRRFAISHDGKAAFRISRKEKKAFFEVYALQDLSFRVFPYVLTLNHFKDIILVNNKPLVLEISVDNDGTCRNCVKSVQIGKDGCSTSLLYQWDGDQIGKYFDGRYVWESGYWIRDLSTGNRFSLLENSDIMLPQNHVPLSHIYYPEHQYLQLVDDKQNIFIDCQQRKIIARYFTDPLNMVFSGIFTGNEFWIGKPDGIYAMPFPVIEEK